MLLLLITNSDTNVASAGVIHALDMSYHCSPFCFYRATLCVSAVFAVARCPALRNDLYCVEWDVKLYYTIPYHTGVRLSVTAEDIVKFFLSAR